VTRALTKAETDVIVWLLRHDFPGAPELRAQVPLTRALGAWNEGSVSLNLAVAAEALPAVVPDGPVPGRAWAYNAKGLATGTVLLWVADGVLEAIEYGWVTDKPPKALPKVTALRDLDDSDPDAH
jgi:hypothetical protein